MPGSASPARPPTAIDDRITSSTMAAPVKRPPRYASLEIGAVWKNDSVRYSASCWIARPMIAPMTVSAAKPRNATVCAIANGELIQTLPLPNEMIAPGITPPAAAIHIIASAANTRK
jgi:hypothetical protein